jgi:hypothetical protein
MSIIEESEIDSESERLEREIQIYKRLIEKAKKNKELSNVKESKVPICLSNLKSPLSNRNSIELSNKEELQKKIKQCSECLIAYGKELL